MTLLLDTHAFLWWLDDPRLLSKAARKAIGDGKNTVYVSAAVAWEIAIKRALGKLDAPDDPEAAIVANRFLPLPITIPHALAARASPDHHRDPFDRILIAQARHEGFKLVSRDPHVPRYGVTRLPGRRPPAGWFEIDDGEAADARAGSGRGTGGASRPLELGVAARIV